MVERKVKIILTNLAIAGALGLSVKVYRDRKRKKESSWTAAHHCARMGVSPLVARKRENRVIATGKALSKLFFVPDTSQQELSSLSSENEENEVSFKEEEANRLLAISVGSLVMTTGGLWVPALNLLSLPAMVYLFVPFFKRGYRSLVNEKRVGLAMLDIVWSSAMLLTGQYVAASLCFCFLYSGERLMIETENRSMNSLINVFSEQPRFGWVLVDDVEVQVAFESIQAGDLVVIQAGQTIAVDGMIADGYAMIDQRTLTGESQPVEKGIGEQVLASTVVLSGKVYVQVEKAGKDTVAAQIGDVLSKTANYQTEMRAIGLRVVEQGAIPTLGFAVLALLTLGSQAAVAALNASFGITLRMAAPIAMLSFLQIASQEGILIKDGRSLELLGQVDTVVFDKTGTLTEEVPTVAQIYAHLYDEDEVLRLTAAAEYKQTHPIAKAILKEARKRDLTHRLPNIADVRLEVGYGLNVSVEEQQVQVGSLRFMKMLGIAIPEAIQQIQEEAYSEGHSLVYVAIDSQFAGAIELCPTIRPEARELVRQLHLKNISTVIISGDIEAPTKKLASTLGISRYFAETLPEDKADLIEQLQTAPKGHDKGTPRKLRRKSVCFVGDGINDSIAMKKAQVSISLSGASTVATDTAGIILMDGTLSQLVPLFDIGQAFKRTTERGIAISILPGIVCLGGIFFLHWGLPTALLLYELNLTSGLANSIWPQLAYQRKKSQQK